MQQRQHLITLTLQCTVFFSQFVGLFKSKCLRANKQESAKASQRVSYILLILWLLSLWMLNILLPNVWFHRSSYECYYTKFNSTNKSFYFAPCHLKHRKTERRKAFTTLCKRWERYIIFGTRFKSLPLNKYDHFVFVCSLRFCATKTVCLCRVWQFFSFSHYQI